VDRPQAGGYNIYEIALGATCAVLLLWSLILCEADRLPNIID